MTDRVPTRRRSEDLSGWERARTQLRSSLTRIARRKAASKRHNFLGSREQILLETRQHPMAILGAFGEAMGLLVPAALVAWGLTGLSFVPMTIVQVIRLVLAFGMACVAARFLWRVLEWEYERVIVTNQKVLHIHGVLSRRIASTPLTKVSELTVSQPLIGRMLAFGSLVVDVPGGREQALHGLRYLPDPPHIYTLITDTARADSSRLHAGPERAVAQPAGASTGDSSTTVIQRVELD